MPTPNDLNDNFSDDARSHEAHAQPEAAQHDAAQEEAREHEARPNEASHSDGADNNGGHNDPGHNNAAHNEAGHNNAGHDHAGGGGDASRNHRWSHDFSRGKMPGGRFFGVVLAILALAVVGIVFVFLPLVVRARAGSRTAQNNDAAQESGSKGSGVQQNGTQQNGTQENGVQQNGPQQNQNNDARSNDKNDKAVPLGPRQDVALGDAPVRGSRNAAVIIVEFADYQCPYCQTMHPELKVLQEELAGKVALAYKDFPLAMHENAEKAAEAARCAGEQGKFWDFHDVLFHNSDRLEVPQLKQYARDLKLNEANFDTCLDSGKEAAAIKKDLAQGRQLGVRGTPSFFFNGRMLSGAMDYYTLRSIVEGVLKSDAPASAAAIPAPPPAPAK